MARDGPVRLPCRADALHLLLCKHNGSPIDSLTLPALAVYHKSVVQSTETWRFWAWGCSGDAALINAVVSGRVVNAAERNRQALLLDFDSLCTAFAT